MYTTSPPEFDQIGLQSDKFIRAAPDEWHGPCPKCGGNDRFVIFTDREYPSWNWFCRQCHPDTGWLDELRPEIKQHNHNLSPQERRQMAEKRALEAERRLQEEIRRAQAALAELREARSWEIYHRQMEERGRLLWKKRGVPEEFQTYWELGWTRPGQVFQQETLSIPVWGYNRKVYNVKHRLLGIEKGKYIQEKRGVPARPFICDSEKTDGALLLVEGEIKSMVAFIEMDTNKLQVAGLPGVTPSRDTLAMFANFEPVYLLLDPDAYPARAVKVAELLGKKRVRLLELPDKVDDLIVAGMLRKPDLITLMKTARRFR